MNTKSDVHTIEVNNTVLHYQERGTGDLVILVHGTVADYRTWRRQLTEFSKQYHVVTYSRRLHYPNTVHDASEYSAQLHSEDLAAIIQRFAATPAHVVTASWGGNVALQLALMRPELVRTIVLGEPPTLPLLSNDSRYAFLVDDFNTQSFFPARSALLRNSFEEGVRSFVDGVMGEGAFNAMPLRVRRYFLDNALELKAESCSKNYIPDFTPEILATIACPVLLVEGDRSPHFFHVILDVLESCLPRAQRARIPNASHGIHVDNAPEYNRHVLSFLQMH